METASPSCLPWWNSKQAAPGGRSAHFCPRFDVCERPLQDKPMPLPPISDQDTAISSTQLSNLLRRMEAERQVISEIVQALNQTANLDELLASIHQALKMVLPAENCFVALHESATDTF